MEPASAGAFGAEAAVTCLNCGAEVAGRYCAECGQDQNVDPRSVGRWLADVGEDLFAVSGRLPRTLRALFVPGLLTLEWLNGRHARYVHPLRLFLVCGLVLFAVPRLLPGEPYVGIELTEVTSDEIASTVWSAETDRRVTEVGPTVMILLMPLFALLLKVTQRGSGRLYAEHLVFALNLHSFALLLFFPLVVLMHWDDRVPDWIENPLLLAFVAGVLFHLYGGLRRVYRSGALRAALLSPVLVLGQIVVIGVSLLAGTGVQSDAPREADRVYARVANAIAADDTATMRELLPRAIALYARLEVHSFDAHRRLHMAHLLMEAGRLDSEVASSMSSRAHDVALECVAHEPERPLCLGMAADAASALGRADEAARLRSRFLAADTGMDDPWGHPSLLERFRSAAGAAASPTADVEAASSSATR